MTDLLTKVKAALEMHESEFAITYDLDELAPDMARALIAAGELADALEHLKVAYDCSDVADPALVAFRAAMEGRITGPCLTKARAALQENTDA